MSAPVTERLVKVKDRLLEGKVKPRRVLTAKSTGRRLIFATRNTTHKHAWVRSVHSSSWAQKMKYVENSVPPTTAPSHN